MKKILILFLVIALLSGVVFGISKASEGMLNVFNDLKEDLDKLPGDDTGNENGGNENNGNENTGNENGGNENNGNENTGNENGGNDNTGNENGGNENTDNGSNTPSTTTKVSSVEELYGATVMVKDRTPAGFIPDGADGIHFDVDNSSTFDGKMYSNASSDVSLSSGARFDFYPGFFKVQDYDVTIIEFDIWTESFYPSEVIFYPLFRYNGQEGSVFAFEEKKVSFGEPHNGDSIYVLQTQGYGVLGRLEGDHTRKHTITMMLDDYKYVVFIDGVYCHSVVIYDYLLENPSVGLASVRIQSGSNATFQPGDNFCVGNFKVVTFGDGNNSYSGSAYKVIVDPTKIQIGDYVEY